MELPAELREVERMRSERHQWASEHYAVTERGLLDRFGPDKRQQGHKEAESRQPARTKPPDSEKVCSVQQPVSPTSVAADSPFNIVALPDSAGRDAKPTKKDLHSAIFSEPPPGPTKVPLQRLAQGKVVGRQQSPAPAPSAGRGFLLHMSQAQVSRYSPSA